MDSSLKQLLEAHASYFKELDNGRIECILNGHHFPPNQAVIEAFINGKKFKKLCERHIVEDLAKKYDPIIVQSRNAPEMLFCVLTGQLINKTQEAINTHMAGKRFLRAKEKMDADEDYEIFDEPDLDEVMKELEEDGEVLEEGVNVDDVIMQPFFSSGDESNGDQDEEEEEGSGLDIDLLEGSSGEEETEKVIEKQPKGKASKATGKKTKAQPQPPKKGAAANTRSKGKAAAAVVEDGGSKKRGANKKNIKKEPKPAMKKAKK